MGSGKQSGVAITVAARYALSMKEISVDLRPPTYGLDAELVKAGFTRHRSTPFVWVAPDTPEARAAAEHVERERDSRVRDSAVAAQKARDALAPGTHVNVRANLTYTPKGARKPRSLANAYWQVQSVNPDGTVTVATQVQGKSTVYGGSSNTVTATIPRAAVTVAESIGGSRSDVDAISAMLRPFQPESPRPRVTLNGLGWMVPGDPNTSDIEAALEKLGYTFAPDDSGHGVRTFGKGRKRVRLSYRDAAATVLAVVLDESLADDAAFTDASFKWADLKGENRRFMFDGRRMLMGMKGGTPSHGSHSTEWFDATGSNDGFDSAVRGWVGIGSRAKNGVIHFAPPITESTFSRGFDCLLWFKKRGAGDKCVVRGFPGKWEQPMGDIVSAASVVERIDRVLSVLESRKVRLAGAEYDLVRENPDGTVVVRNDNGDEFSTEPGEAFTIVNGPVKRAAGTIPPEVKMTRAEFIQASAEKDIATAVAALEAVKADIRKDYLARRVKLPPGIEPWQHVQALENPRGNARQFAASLRVAMQNVETRRRDATNGYATRHYGAIHANLVASAAASGYDVPAGVLRDYPKIVKRGV